MDLNSVPTRDVRDFVAGLFEIIDGWEWHALSGVFAENCVYHRPGYAPFVGLSRIEHFYREERVIASGKHEIEDVVGDMSMVMCTGRFRGHDGDGRVLDERFSDLYRITHGRIMLRRTYFYRAAI